MSDGGKGSKPRPFSVAQDEYNNRWDAIFARDLQKEEELKKKLMNQLEAESDRLGLYNESSSSNTDNRK
jgi:hypothetical protein